MLTGLRHAVHAPALAVPEDDVVGYMGVGLLAREPFAARALYRQLFVGR